MTADNVIILPVTTTLDVPAERVLNAVREYDDIDKLLVIGSTHDGDFFMHISTSQMSELFFLLKQAEAALMREM